MRLFLIPVLAALQAMGPVFAHEEMPDLNGLSQKAKAVSPELSRFVERKFECYHWDGEEPYDKARAQEIAHSFKRLRCATLEREERRLRKTHASRPDAIEVLDEAAGL